LSHIGSFNFSVGDATPTPTPIQTFTYILINYQSTPKGLLPVAKSSTHVYPLKLFLMISSLMMVALGIEVSFDVENLI